MSRSRMLVTLFLATALLAPAARADGGPTPGVSVDGNGIADEATGLRYAAVPRRGITIVTARDRSKRVVRTRTIGGAWGIPFVTFDGTKGGLSPDGKTLVLARLPAPAAGLAVESSMLVLDTGSLRPRRRITLTGDFAFDALSPDGRTLFLIQHSSATDLQRYRVRAYDLARGRLRRDAIVDRAEPNMAGSPLKRLAAEGGAWVYTLYVHGDEPFVHALDTVHAAARCLDLPWRGNQDRLWTSRLSLRHGGNRLAVIGRHGGRLATLDLGRPDGGGSPMGWAAAGAGAMVLAATAAVLWRRRRLS